MDTTEIFVEKVKEGFDNFEKMQKDELKELFEKSISFVYEKILKDKSEEILLALGLALFILLAIIIWGKIKDKFIKD